MHSVDNIIDFPDEILLKIFKYLYPSDRRVASECCSRFLNIWLSNDFIEDRRLDFNECKMSLNCEPLATFRNSQRVYRHFTLGDNTVMEYPSDFHDFFGEMITSVEMERSGDFCWKKYPNLKTITVPDVATLGNINKLPKNLEEIVIIDHRNDENNRIKVKDLKRIPKSVKIELQIEDLDKSDKKLFEQCGDTIRTLEWNDYYSTNYFTKLRLPNLEKLILGLDLDDVDTFDESLDNFIERFPSLEYFELRTWAVLPPVNWPCLKKLEIRNLRQEDLIRLMNFENLEELLLGINYDFVSDSNGKCFFVHKPYLNSNLKKLEIEFDSVARDVCPTCFKVMIKTFPNLENLSINFEIPQGVWKKLKTNIPHLRSLSFGHFSSNTNYLHRELLEKIKNLSELMFWNFVPIDVDDWPLMPHLRTLRIEFDKLNAYTAKMFEKVPALERLTIKCKHDPDNYFELIEIIAQPLKRLKDLTVDGLYKQSVKIRPEIIDSIALNCKYLKRVNFNGTFTDDNDEVILKEIIAKHSSLREINDVYAYQKWKN